MDEPACALLRGREGRGRKSYQLEFRAGRDPRSVEAGLDQELPERGRQSLGGRLGREGQFQQRECPQREVGGWPKGIRWFVGSRRAEPIARSHSGGLTLLAPAAFRGR